MILKKTKSIFGLKGNLKFLLILPLIAIVLFFGFRKSMAMASNNARIIVLEAKTEKQDEEIKNWKKLYFEVYGIADEYRKTVKEINDLVYFKNMPVGGQNFDPPIKETDRLTIKTLQDTISSFKELQNSLLSVEDYLKARQKFLSEFPFIYPLKSSGTIQISSFFGFREDLFAPKDKKSLRFHSGIDLAGKIGDPVVATVDGEVEIIEEDNPSLGKMIILKHNYSFETVYAHLSAIKVKIGQKIKREDVIGLVGDTGETTGPHLHYEIRIGGISQDPLNFLSATY